MSARGLRVMEVLASPCDRPKSRLALVDRFWSKVEKGDGAKCWLWTAAVNDAGYGIIGIGGRRDGVERAHRLSWMLYHGPIPAGLVVCHRCDVPACVKPEHLFLGTLSDNHQDMRAKGRHSNPPRHLGLDNNRARAVEWNGETRTITDWAHIAGLKKETLRVRLDHGWPMDEAMLRPLRSRPRRRKLAV